MLLNFAPSNTAMSNSIEPSAVVKRQLDAFNSRDIEAIMSMYLDDAEMFEFPSTLLVSGAAAIRDHFNACFQEPNLHASLRSSMVIDPREIVIALLHTTRTFPGRRRAGLAYP